MAATKSGGSKRGFAAMDPAKQREIASKGGKASHGGGRKASSQPLTSSMRIKRRRTSCARRFVYVPAAQRAARFALNGAWPIGRTSARATSGGAIAAVIAIHAALLFAFLHLSGQDRPRAIRSGADASFDLTARRLRRRRRPCSSRSRGPRRRKAVRRPRTSGARRRRSSRPSRRVVTPPVQQIAASETPRQGAAPTQGASDVRGPGHRRGRVRATAPAAAAGGNGPAAAVATSPSRRGSSRRCSLAATSPATCSSNGPAARPYSCACGSTRAAMSANAPSTAGLAFRRSMRDLCNVAHDRLRFRPGAQSQRAGGCRMVRIRATSAAIIRKGNHMIEAEWWEYDSLGRARRRGRRRRRVSSSTAQSTRAARR